MFGWDSLLVALISLLQNNDDVTQQIFCEGQCPILLLTAYHYCSRSSDQSMELLNSKLKKKFFFLIKKYIPYVMQRQAI